MMKTIALVCVLFFVVTASITVVCFAQEKDYYIPKRYEELWGIWINEKYGSGQAYGKWVIQNWGYSESFTRLTDATPKERWTITIVDKYTDDDGNLWYRTYDRTDNGASGYGLYKISNDNTVLETSWNTIGFPTTNDIETKIGGYRIYYRQ